MKNAMRKLVGVLSSIVRRGRVAATASLLVSSTSAGAQKPTLMIMPADDYMQKHGFTVAVSQNGSAKVRNDYSRAFREDSRLNDVISAIEGVFSDRSYNLVQLAQKLRSLENDAVVRQASDREVTVSPLDQVLATAQPDIRFDLYFEVASGFAPTVQFRLTALDAYTDESVASTTGSGASGSASMIPSLLKEAVVQRLPEFEARLQHYFDALGVLGRPIRVDFKLDASAGITFDTEFGGEELGDIVETLTTEAAVGHAVQVGPGTTTMRSFSTVRIPLRNASGRPYSANSWAGEQLARPLSSKYGLTVRRNPLGLGYVELVISRKVP